MSRRHPGARLCRGQQGVSVIAAVFLLLLMAALAAFMANLMSITSLNQAADVGGSRAYQAARAGVERGLYALDPNGKTLALPDCSGVPATIAVPGHSVALGCEMFPPGGGSYAEGGQNIRIFRITATATASNARAPGVVRVVQVTVEKCRNTAVSASDPAPYDC